MGDTTSPENMFYDLVSADEVDDAHKLEVAGFPEDEAASLTAFRVRQAEAPDLFLGAFLPGTSPDTKRKLIAYVNATLSRSPVLTHSSMSQHIAGGTSVCIHAVCVDRALLRRGIATALLKEYLRRLDAANAPGAVRYARALLIVHEELTPLYERIGFELVGRSEVIHGSRPWYEMRWVVPSAASAAPAVAKEDHSQQIPAGLWEALTKSSSRTRPSGKMLSEEFTIEQTVEYEECSEEKETGEARNKYDLLCPRPGCGSVILKKHVAKYVQRENVQMEPPDHTNPLLKPLDAPPALGHWWLITPNAMAFENIGFSKPVTSDEKPKKLLACAECDLGPVGWCLQGSSEFWVSCERVRYRE
ncbi:acyl-CoA N-acyltransferase [Dentipellis sp. KUC8613]|nr:acyl-CoA N-acyltransferase [Dentipellis sp. KUC8613]